MARAKTVASSSPATESLIDLLNGTKYFPLIVTCDRSGIRLLDTELSAPPEYQQGFLADRHYAPSSILSKVARGLSKSNRLVLILSSRNFDAVGLHRLLDTLPNFGGINGTYSNKTACLVTEGWLSLVGKAEARKLSSGNFSAARICDDQTLTELQIQNSLDSVAKLCNCFDEMTNRQNQPVSKTVEEDDLRSLQTPAIAQILVTRQTQADQFEKILAALATSDSNAVTSKLLSIADVLISSGMVLCTQDMRTQYCLVKKPGRILFERLKDGKQVRPIISLLASLRVVPVETLKNQRIVNLLASHAIQLEPDEFVRQLEPKEFFSYFDRVMMHVPRKSLKSQVQLWLDRVTEWNPDFGSDIEAKREFANGLNSRIFAKGWRFQCWRKDCAEPATLCLYKQGGSEHGTFSTVHQLNGRARSHKTSVTLLPLHILIK